MQEELRLHHLPRYEKKRLVKGWHATQAPSSPFQSDDPNEADRIARSGSMRFLFATPPGALEYESQRTGTWRSVPNTTEENGDDQDDLHNRLQGDKLPKTVGQVKHAYRARARHEEVRDASNALRKREKFLELKRGPRWRERGPKRRGQKPTPLEFYQEDANKEDNEDGEAVVDAHQCEVSAELQLLDLPEDEVVTNAAYRDEVLRQIRCQLAKGGEVLLQSDCTTSKESISNARLMLQTLCTRSLAYCVRDQNVVPENLTQLQLTTRLALRLLPRHQPAS